MMMMGTVEGDWPGTWVSTGKWTWTLGHTGRIQMDLRVNRLVLRPTSGRHLKVGRRWTYTLGYSSNLQ